MGPEGESGRQPQQAAAGPQNSGTGAKRSRPNEEWRPGAAEEQEAEACETVEASDEERVEGQSDNLVTIVIQYLPGERTCERTWPYTAEWAQVIEWVRRQVHGLQQGWQLRGAEGWPTPGAQPTPTTLTPPPHLPTPSPWQPRASQSSAHSKGPVRWGP